MSRSDDELSRPILDDEAETAGRIVNDADDNELDEQLSGCGASACCDPSASCHRFLALIFMCLVGFGEYICDGIPFYPVYQCVCVCFFLSVSSLP